MWGLLLSAATIFVSFLTDGKGQAAERGSTSSRSAGSSDSKSQSLAVSRIWSSLAASLRIPDDRVFLSGALLGVGLSLLCATISQQFHLGQRGRLWLRSWWYWEDPADLPLRVPAPLVRHVGGDDTDATSNGSEDQAAVMVQRDSHGSVRLLVSPHRAATQHLQVAHLTIRPGREIPPGPAPGTEFYLVLEGSGVVSQQGIAATSELHKGDAFVVEVGRMRWISNPALADDLVLLRASDVGNHIPGFGERIRQDPNRRPSPTTAALEALQDGFRRVHTLARDYL